MPPICRYDSKKEDIWNLKRYIKKIYVGEIIRKVTEIIRGYNSDTIAIKVPIRESCRYRETAIIYIIFISNIQASMQIVIAYLIPRK